MDAHRRAVDDRQRPVHLQRRPGAGSALAVRKTPHRIAIAFSNSYAIQQPSATHPIHQLPPTIQPFCAQLPGKRACCSIGGVVLVSAVQLPGDPLTCWSACERRSPFSRRHTRPAETNSASTLGVRTQSSALPWSPSRASLARRVRPRYTEALLMLLCAGRSGL